MDGDDLFIQEAKNLKDIEDGLKTVEEGVRTCRRDIMRVTSRQFGLNKRFMGYFAT